MSDNNYETISAYTYDYDSHNVTYVNVEVTDKSKKRSKNTSSIALSLTILGIFAALICLGWKIAVGVFVGLIIMLLFIGFYLEYRRNKPFNDRIKRDQYNKIHGIVSDEQFEELHRFYKKIPYIEESSNYRNMTIVQKKKVIKKLRQIYPDDERLENIEYFLYNETL